ncbi:MAG: response regulator [Planctomycetota bacterium]|nr:MAG: response regulator [Planctomycetota bacterium]
MIRPVAVCREEAGCLRSAAGKRSKGKAGAGEIKGVMATRKTVFTTGEVAKLCNVAPRTVSKWFDAGHLRGYRIPGSKDRRIPLDQLVRFMRAHGIPLNGLDTGATRVLVFDRDVQWTKALQSSLEAQGDYEVRSAESAFEAGALLREHKPHVFLVDVRAADVEPKTIVRGVRALDLETDVCVVAIGADLTAAEGEGLMQAGFDGYLSKPFEARTLMDLIERRIPAGRPS